MEDKIRKRVVLDLDLCVECRSCGAACFYGHHNQPIVNYGVTAKVSMPVICRQCDDPACVASCPVRALSFEEMKEDAARRRLQTALHLADGGAL